MTPFAAQWKNDRGEICLCRVFGFVSAYDPVAKQDRIYAVIQGDNGGPLTNVDFFRVTPFRSVDE